MADDTSISPIPLLPEPGKAHHYLWKFLCLFGEECYKTWRQELLASVVVSIITCAITYANDKLAFSNLKTALWATLLTLATFAIWHLCKIPYLLTKRHDRSPKIAGVFGIVIVVCLMAGAATGAGVIVEHWNLKPTPKTDTAKDDGSQTKKFGGGTVTESAKASNPPPTAPKQQKCETGSICNQDSPNQGVQVADNRRYGVPEPAPELSVSQSPLPPSEEVNQLTKEDPSKLNPGAVAKVVLNGNFSRPRFVITCNVPCVFNHAFAVHGMTTTKPVKYDDDNKTVNVILSSPSEMEKDDEIDFYLRSRDSGPLSITIKAYVEPISPKPQ